MDGPRWRHRRVGQLRLSGGAEMKLEDQLTKTEIQMPVIDPAKYAQRLTTSLNLLRKAGACESRYRVLLKALGGVSFDHDEPINLLTILDLNGTEDCIWALCATAENCDTIAR